MTKKELLDVIKFIERQLIYIREIYITGTENKLKQELEVLANQIKFFITDIEEVL